MKRRKRQKVQFEPCADQQALIPEVSGNDINGLGDHAQRRPSPVYWHSPSDLAHGAQQTWMLQRTAELVPEIRDLNAALGGRGPKKRAAQAENQQVESPDQAAAAIKRFALEHEADLVGIAAFDPLWVFDGYEVSAAWIIVLGLAMDYAELATAPEPPSVIEVMRQYNRGTRAARALADWIAERGYDAIPHGGPQAGPVTMIPAALACGFGELGKHGSIINRQFGASFRLACVLTDMPLVADQADQFGVDDFCSRCNLCSTACPPDAIADHKQLVRGATKWYVNFDKCVPYFNETHGCGICIAVCPWSRPGVAPSLAQKMTRRQERLRAEE